MGLTERKQINNGSWLLKNLYLPQGGEGWGNAITGAAGFLSAGVNSFSPAKTSTSMLNDAGLSTGYGPGFTYVKQNSPNYGKELAELSRLNTQNTLNTATAGATAGAAFGPIGAGIGFLAGGITGLIGGGARKRDFMEQMKQAKLDLNAFNDYSFASGLSGFLTLDYNTRYDNSQDSLIYHALNGKMPKTKLRKGLEPNAMVSNGEIIGHVDDYGNVIDAVRVGHGKDNKDTVPVHLEGGKEPSDNSFVITNKGGLSDYVAATGDVKGGLLILKQMKEYQRYRLLWNGKIPGFYMGKGISDIDVKGSDVDTRSDTTRRGQHEGQIPYGAGNGPAGQGPMMLMEVGPGLTNPNLQYGEVPGVGLNPRAIMRRGMRKLGRMEGMRSYEGYEAEVGKYGPEFWEGRPGMESDPNIIGQTQKREELLGDMWKAQKKKEALEDLAPIGAAGAAAYNEYKKNYKCGKMPRYSLGKDEDKLGDELTSAPIIFKDPFDGRSANYAGYEAMKRRLFELNNDLSDYEKNRIYDDIELQKQKAYKDYYSKFNGYLKNSSDDIDAGAKRKNMWVPGALGALGILAAFNMMPKGGPHTSDTYAANPYESQIRSNMSRRRANILNQIAAVRDAEARSRYDSRTRGTSVGVYIPSMVAMGLGTLKNIANILAQGHNLNNQYLQELANMDYLLGNSLAQRMMNSNQFRDSRYDRSASKYTDLRNNSIAEALRQMQYAYGLTTNRSDHFDTMGLFDRDYALKADELRRKYNS